MNKKDVYSGSHIPDFVLGENPRGAEYVAFPKSFLLMAISREYCGDAIIRNSWILDLEIKLSSNYRFGQSGWNTEIIQEMIAVVQEEKLMSICP